ncbi:MAG: dockerin type I domain-containing protein, partial [Dehalococcoidales bacterium]|nr:dockerin type I domain-containing protein [Dehalococcoidales bacterium]
VTAGQTLSFTISATDPDGDNLAYSASNLPDGAGFNDSARTFTWAPAAGQAGYYQDIRFQVSDGSLSDSENINITVTVQQEPEENAWDINRDGEVNASDTDIVVQHWGESGSPGWIAADVNLDGKISALDLILIGQNWTGA